MNIVRFIQTVSGLLTILILIDVLASWVPSFNRSEFVVQVRRVTDPILMPFRRIIPPETLGIDVSPIAAFIVIRLLESFLVNALR